MTYDLEDFRLQDMIDAGRRLRLADEGHASMEAAASFAVELLYESFRQGGAPAGEPACVLARCFKTHPFHLLPDDLRARASAMLKGETPAPEMQCLTLLASRGELPAWNDRHSSRGHQAIPLPTREIVQRAPMIAELILQLGMEIERVIRPSAVPEELLAKTFEVFHVEEVPGSAMVPDQEFVRRHGVRSVIGFGGLLPAGELFAMILFARVRISKDAAALFRTLALQTKLLLLPFSGKRVFAESDIAESRVAP